MTRGQADREVERQRGAHEQDAPPTNPTTPPRARAPRPTPAVRPERRGIRGPPTTRPTGRRARDGLYPMYAVNAREAYSLRSWTRSGTPTPRRRPAPARARRPRRAARRVRRRASSGWPAADPSARSCSPGCAASARRCSSTRCARPRSAPAGAPGSSRRGPTSRCVARSRRPCTRRCASSGRPAGSGDHALGVVKAFAQREPAGGTGRGAARLRDRWNPGIAVPAVTGRADSGDIEIDLVELLSDLGGMAADTGRGIAVFIDEMQDLGPDDVSALCAACHEISQSGLPVIVVGAGLPHLPSVLQRRSPTPRGCSATRGSTGSTVRPPTPRSSLPAEDEGAGSPPRRSRRCTPPPAATPTSSRPTARRSGTWPRLPDHGGRRRGGGPEAEAELAVGFFGSRYERATPGEREYLRAMADVAVEAGRRDGCRADRRRRRAPRAQAAVAVPGARRAAQEGPDLLGERGRIAFTVPHFGRYLLEHAPRGSRAAEEPTVTIASSRSRRQWRTRCREGPRTGDGRFHR